MTRSTNDLKNTLYIYNGNFVMIILLFDDVYKNLILLGIMHCPFNDFSRQFTLTFFFYYGKTFESLFFCLMTKTQLASFKLSKNIYKYIKLNRSSKSSWKLHNILYLFALYIIHFLKVEIYFILALVLCH